MAATSGAFGSKCGFNQSAGGYYTILADIAPANLSNVSVAASGSGGAFVPAQLAAYNWSVDGPLSSLLTAGNVLKDMGKTIAVGTRTYRKVQAVSANSGNTFGVTGSAAVAPAAGYLTGYLEVSGPNGGATTVNRLARAF